MGYKSTDTTLHVEIDGHEYAAPLDSAQFIDWYKSNADKIAAFNDEETTGAEIVEACVGCVNALFGAEAARELFNGEYISVANAAGIINYIFEEAKAQGLLEILRDLTAKYSAAEII